MEMAFAGLNAIARDYAKLGEIYRLGGLLMAIELCQRNGCRRLLLLTRRI